MRKRLVNRFSLSFLFTITILALVLYITRNQWDQYWRIRELRIITVIYLSIIVVIIEVMRGYTLKLLISIFNVRLKTMDWLGLVFSQALINFLPLSAGLASNAIFLKHKKNLPVTRFTSCLLGDMVVVVVSSGLFGVIALGIRYWVGDGFHTGFFLISLCMIVAGLLLFLQRIPVDLSRGRFFRWLFSIQEGLGLIRSRKSVLIIIIMIRTVILLLSSLRFWVVFQGLNIELDLPAIMVLTVMTNVIRISQILPGNLGFREALAGWISSSFGLFFSSGVLVAVIVRIAEMFWIFLLGSIFTYIIWAGKRDLIEEKADP